MAYLVVEDFKGGLDRRRMAISSPPGTLQTLTNAHISRGGEVEKRKAWSSKYTLPAGTYGFASAADVLYVFGSIADPGVPSGVTYQRLQHPDSLAMIDLITAEVFDGKVYAVAEFVGGDVLHFNDGTAVDDWLSGVVRTAMTDKDGIAAHLAAIIDKSEDYGATSAGAVVTITGASNVAFDVVTETTDGGGTADQTAVAAKTQTAVAAVAEVLATASFRILGGTSSAGTNKVSQVQVNGVNLMTSAVDWATSDAVTAAAVASEINGTTSSPNYTAEADGDMVTISAVAGSGATPNGFAVRVTVGGDVIVTTGGFTVTAGTSSAGTNKVNSITVNGVDILGAAVDWTTSHSATATALAAQINSNTSSPDYGAFADGPDVLIGALIASNTTPTGHPVVVNVGGDVTVGDINQVVTTATAMSGGVTAETGQAQISTVTIGGTFEVGDEFKITLGEDVLTGGRVAGEKAKVIRVLKDTVFATFGSVLARSGIGEPTAWNANDVGSAIVDMSSQASGAANLTGLGVYQNNLAVFSRNVIQTRFIDADPASDSQLQVLNNIGSISPKSIVNFGDEDVFFLSTRGVRTMKARDSSNNARVDDIGTPIDGILIAHMRTLTETQIAAAPAAIDPEDGRYLLALGSTIYVFSFFSSSRISAWSICEPGFTVSDFAVNDGRLYARAGDTIYLYGGDGGDVYDASAVTIETPYLDAKRIATWKQWTGFDIGLEGLWTVSMNSDPGSPDTWEVVAITDRSTYGLLAIPFDSEAPMVKFKFEHASAEYARIANFVAHYKELKAA